MGAIDGILICIIQPTRNSKGTYEVINVRDFFLGHYKHLGLNAQAVSDERLRFPYAGVAMPGSQPDCSAYAVTSLKKKVESLPPGFHLAYVLSEHMLIPYSGSQRDDPAKSAYNYFLSQLRIHVEQTFARFTGKFHILKKTLDMNLDNVLACVRLHNFIIENGQVDDYDPDAALCEGELAGGSHVWRGIIHPGHQRVSKPGGIISVLATENSGQDRTRRLASPKLQCRAQLIRKLHV